MLIPILKIHNQPSLCQFKTISELFTLNSDSYNLDSFNLQSNQVLQVLSKRE